MARPHVRPCGRGHSGASIQLNIMLIIGATYTDDILERIFNDFCIGK